MQSSCPADPLSCCLPFCLPLCLPACLQDLSDGLVARERKVAAERSELDQQRRFQDRQGAQLVRELDSKQYTRAAHPLQTF